MGITKSSPYWVLEDIVEIIPVPCLADSWQNVNIIIVNRTLTIIIFIIEYYMYLKTRKIKLYSV